MADFFKVVAPTLHFEGGYSDRPDDPGNYCQGQLIGTMRGIAAATYMQYRYYKTGVWRCPTVSEMKAITPEIATDVFYVLFWQKLINGDKINDQYVAFMCFQEVIGAVSNLSIARTSINKISKKYNQKLIVESDTAFNDYTVQVINSLPSKELFLQMYEDYYKHLVYVNDTWYKGVNKGWFTRMKSIYDWALESYKYVKQNPGKTTLAIGFFLPLDYLDTAIYHEKIKELNPEELIG